MHLNKPIDFQNVEALSRLLRAERVLTGRFSLEISEKDACNGIYAAMKAVVEHRGCTFALDDDTKQHIIAAARWLIDSHTPPGLLLCGLCGNGKTSLAKAIAWLIGYITEHENGYSNRKYMRLHTAKAICHSFGTQDYEGICNSEMIIIDDLGEEPKEVLKYGQPETPIIDLLNERYVHQRITVITSNLETDALRAKYGERVYDRLREMVTSVVFENDSYRGRK